MESALELLSRAAGMVGRDDEDEDGPIDMSMKRKSDEKKNNSKRPRPSVIMSTAKRKKEPEKPTKKKEKSPSPPADRSIDDHFRRSLSAIDYGRAFDQHQLDDVDDHFAKALGNDTWIKIKNEQKTVKKDE